MRSTAGAVPSNTTSTEPSPRLRTVPATPSRWASCRHDSRKPTPWTRPEIRTRRRMVSGPVTDPWVCPATAGSVPERALRATPDGAVGLEAVGCERVVGSRRDADPLRDRAPHGELRLSPPGDGVLVVAGVGARGADDESGRGPGHHAEHLLRPGGLDPADARGDHDGVGGG